MKKRYDDMLEYVIEKYGKEISDYLKLKTKNYKDISISFFSGSDKLVDSLQQVNKNLLEYPFKTKYEGHSFDDKFNVKFLQDYTFNEDEDENPIVSDFNLCVIEELRFIKVVTPFTMERAYDFIIAKTEDMEKILYSLKERETRKNFKFNEDIPIIGFDFKEIEESTIKFLLNEEFRTYCKTKHIKLKRGIILQGKPGCLSGDTKLLIRNESGYYTETISLENAYYKFNKIENKEISFMNFWKTKKYVQSFINGKLEYRPINSILFSGKKEVFLLETENGFKIKATKDHPFKILDDKIKNRGISEKDDFVALKDLTLDDEIFVKDVNKVNKTLFGGRKKRKEVDSLKFYPYGWIHKVNGYEYKRSNFARLSIEAKMNDLDVSEFIDIIRNDEVKSQSLNYLLPELIVHHIDENPLNDDLKNLEVLTKEEHDKLHSNSQHFQDTNCTLDKIVSIKSLGIQDTFDVSMDGNSKNFIANNIVVHNTGKTLTLQWLRKQAELNHISYRQFKSVDEFIEDASDYYSNNKKIFVFEDFDAALMERKKTGEAPNQILGKVLNTLEGVEEIDDVVSIFTTNKIDLFDEAFIRPGRIDKVFNFNLPDYKNYIDFFQAYIPEEHEFFEAMADDLDVSSVNVSYAVLKGICDDINIFKFSGKILTKQDIIDIIKEKLNSTNKTKDVKKTSELIL